VDPITRQNLDDALDRQAKTIEKNLELVISPISKTLEEHHASLYGKGGSNGLSGTVKGLTLKVKLLIIVLGVFFTTGIAVAGRMTWAFIKTQMPELFS